MNVIDKAIEIELLEAERHTNQKFIEALSHMTEHVTESRPLTVRSEFTRGAEISMRALKSNLLDVDRKLSENEILPLGDVLYELEIDEMDADYRMMRLGDFLRGEK